MNHRGNVLFIALALALAAALPGADDARAYFSTDTTPRAWAARDNAEWMKRVADSRKLSALSIPGTHDTCARVGGAYVECQSLALKDQFAIGIRFLDVRCRRRGDAFAIHHGLVFQNMNFGDVQDACVDFLSAHPSECIVINVQEEYTPADDPPPFETTFRKYILGHEKFWHIAGGIPTMGEVRGKIVLVSHALQIGGFQWSAFDMQNEWTVSTPYQIPGKWMKIQAKLDDAVKGSADTWFLNFASASGVAAFPSVIAKNVNARLFQWLGEGKTQRVGTILMDFPGEKLVDRIIRTNFGKEETAK